MATMGLECVIIACGHGNCANPVVSCAKFDAHTHHHCQEIHNNKYYRGLLLVAMGTIELSPKVYGDWCSTLVQYCNKLKYLFIARSLLPLVTSM